MAKAKKPTSKKKGSNASKASMTDAQLEDHRAAGRAYYHAHKERLKKDKRQYWADVKAGKRVVVPKKGTKKEQEKQREKWRINKMKNYHAKRLAKNKENLENYNKLYGTGSDNG